MYFFLSFFCRLLLQNVQLSPGVLNQKISHLSCQMVWQLKEQSTNSYERKTEKQYLQKRSHVVPSHCKQAKLVSISPMCIIIFYKYSMYSICKASVTLGCTSCDRLLRVAKCRLRKTYDMCNYQGNPKWTLGNTPSTIRFWTRSVTWLPLKWSQCVPLMTTESMTFQGHK